MWAGASRTTGPLHGARGAGWRWRAFAILIVHAGLVLPVEPSPAGQPGDPEAAARLYLEHCAACHGAGRLGGLGPALLPENLARVRRAAALEIIAAGAPATQMPAFAGILDEAEIESLADLIFTPLDEVPSWGAAEIEASRVIHEPGLLRGDAGSARPVYDADPLNLFLVVETGDHHVTVLDGDRFEPIHRFKSRIALHGGPKYSSDGRFVYLASRDGWISKFDMYRLRTVAEVRAGINTRNAAVSSDDRLVIVGNYLPHSLVILDAGDLSLLELIPVRDGHGRSSRVSAVYNAPPRGSFIVALKDIPEVWEVGYEAASPVPRRGPSLRRRPPGEAPPPSFPVRRVQVDGYLDDFFFDQEYRFVIGASRDGGGQIVDLDAGRVTARLDLPGLPHLGSGITWEHEGRTVLATPNLEGGEVTVIDLETREIVARIETLGPGFFLRSHERSRYAWVDVFFGPHRDAMHVIDKASLRVVRTLRPEPGRTTAHVEFDRSGRHALLSVWESDGALLVYDAETLEVVKRLPMARPSGKYNVYNKITYAEGTSH
jgi:mono/diheme cytochrome c family protein